MQSGLRLCACAAVVLTMAGSIALAAEYNLRDGMTISQARAQLLKDGWTPVRIDKKIFKDGTIGNQSADGRVLFAAGYFEVEDCTGTGINSCLFNYQRNGRCLRLITEGEYLPPVAEPVLVRWNTDCPD